MKCLDILEAKVSKVSIIAADLPKFGWPILSLDVSMTDL
jgi:hypothetical protein